MNEIIIALLSGAVGGSVITALFEYFKVKYKFRTDYLRKQIDNLYGPLYIVLSHSSKHLEIANSILSAHREHFSRKDWSQEESTQKKLESESTETIDVSNKYVAAANTNNEKIFTIIMKYYSLIDLEDIDIVDDFLRNYVRLRIENAGDKKLPFMIYKLVGDISFLPIDFKDSIMKKFSAKKVLLENQSTLLGGVKSCIRRVKK